MDLVNFLFLAGMGAIAVPVLIHLLRSRNFQPASLGTIRFLQLALKETARWRKLKDLLLLLLRIAMIVLLAFLFARPFFSVPEETGDKKLNVVIMIDTSGSMSGTTLGVTNLELAMNHAKNIISKLPESTPVTIAAFSDQIQPVADLEQFGLMPAGKADYAKALQWAAKRFDASLDDEKKIYLITDLQQVSLPKNPMVDWPVDIHVKLIGLAQAGGWNRAVTNVENLTPFATGEGKLKVSVQGFGDVPKGDYSLILEIEGHRTAQCELDCQAGSIILDWPADEAGTFKGVVRLKSKDSYELDDEKHFVIHLKRPARVLLVDGAPGKTSFENETYFIEKALQAGADEHTSSGFSIMRCEGLNDPEGYDVVALCNVAGFSGHEVDLLEQYVKAGGAVVYFLGESIQCGNYNHLADCGVFPAKMEQLSLSIPRQITDWNVEHHALKAFKHRESGNLSRIVFNQAFNITPLDDVEVLAKLSNGSPAILETSLGNGCVFVVANPCDRDWSDWPVEKIFLPFVREIFGYLSGRQTGHADVMRHIRSSIERRLPGIYQEAGMEVVSAHPGESDIRAADESGFEVLLGVPLEEDIRVVKAAPIQIPKQAEQKNEIWKWLALSLLLLSVLEQAFAELRKT